MSTHPSPSPVLRVDPATTQTARMYPSISLLLPLDNDGTWRPRLRGLARVAEDRLRAEFGRHVDRNLLRRVWQAVTGVEAPPDARSLAVYVNGDGVSTVPLSVTVRERVVIDDTFATRDMVHAENRAPGFWLLALALDRPRLLRGRGRQLSPELIALPAWDDPEPSRQDRGRLGRDRSDVVEARRTRRLRAIDRALDEPLGDNDDPVVVVGVEPTLSRFLRLTRHAGRIEAPVRRAADGDLGELADRVWPVVAHVLAERRELALSELARAVGAQRAATGPNAVWRAARRTKTALLLVEETFEYPARVLLNDRLHPDDPAAPGVIDDAVDEMIEHVLARGGRVEIVPDGALTGHARIALVDKQAPSVLWRSARTWRTDSSKERRGWPKSS